MGRQKSSMQDDDALLLDMLIAARDAVAFVSGASWEEFRSNRMMRAAVQYTVQTIGEAANDVSMTTRAAHAEIPWARIVGMRHRLVHGYRDVDLEIVWDVIQNHLPALIAALEPLVPPEKDQY